MLEGTGYTTRLKMDHVVRANEHFEKVRQSTKNSSLRSRAWKRPSSRSQIPGGMLSNMESQLKQQGAGDKMKEVLEEVPQSARIADIRLS